MRFTFGTEHQDRMSTKVIKKIFGCPWTSLTCHVFSRNKENSVYPFKSQSYYIKVGFKMVKII